MTWVTGIHVQSYNTWQYDMYVSLYMTDASSGAGTDYPSGTSEFTLGFSGVYDTLSLVFCVLFCRSLFALLFFVFLLTIVFFVFRKFTGFCLRLWYLQTVLTLRWRILFLYFCEMLIYNPNSFHTCCSYLIA